jgi:hypothetical protein
MPLAADALTHLAIHRYFGNVAARDGAAVLSLFAEDAVMEVASLGISYVGKAAIAAHFDEFLAAYPQISFAAFEPIADAGAGKIAVRFRIMLEDHAGVRTAMHNLNLFSIDSAGLLRHVVIYMSAAPKLGFAAGATESGR